MLLDDDDLDELTLLREERLELLDDRLEELNELLDDETLLLLDEATDSEDMLLDETLLALDDELLARLLDAALEACEETTDELLPLLPAALDELVAAPPPVHAVVNAQTIGIHITQRIHRLSGALIAITYHFNWPPLSTREASASHRFDETHINHE